MEEFKIDIIDWYVDFNGMSTHQGLFQTKMLGKFNYYIFIF